MNDLWICVDVWWIFDCLLLWWSTNHETVSCEFFQESIHDENHIDDIDKLVLKFQ
jgi:hypothetical protein